MSFPHFAQSRQLTPCSHLSKADLTFWSSSWPPKGDPLCMFGSFGQLSFARKSCQPHFATRVGLDVSTSWLVFRACNTRRIWGTCLFDCLWFLLGAKDLFALQEGLRSSPLLLRRSLEAQQVPENKAQGESFDTTPQAPIALKPRESFESVVLSVRNITLVVDLLGQEF